jgi:hypothetical protein
MKNIRLLALIIVSITLSNCGLPNKYGTIRHKDGYKHYLTAQETLDKLETSEICCTNLRDFHYETLKLNTTENFDINHKSPAYNFSTGKSYFQAFELPKSDKPYEVIIESHFPIASSIFYPNVIIMDKNLKNVIENSQIAFEMTDNALLKNALRAAIKISPNSNQTYLLINTTDSLMKKVDLTTTKRLVYVNGVSFYKYDDIAMHYGPIGTLEVITKEINQP